MTVCKHCGARPDSEQDAFLKQAYIAAMQGYVAHYGNIGVTELVHGEALTGKSAGYMPSMLGSAAVRMWHSFKQARGG